VPTKKHPKRRRWRCGRAHGEKGSKLNQQNSVLFQTQQKNDFPILTYLNSIISQVVEGIF
jgi:hypothetical protein